MGAVAQLAETTLSVEPGRSQSLTLTVRNTGSVVDRFSFEAVGVAAPWVKFTPDALSLFPGASGSVQMSFAPPRDPAVAAGEVPFGVKVGSAEDPDHGTVEEGTLNVGAFSNVTIELVPRITRGRRVARAQLAVDNRSNCPYRAEVMATDPSESMDFAMNPVSVDVPPGAAEFVKLRMRYRETFWRGPSKTRPYRVTLHSLGVMAGGAAPALVGVGASEAKARAGGDSAAPGGVITAPLPVDGATKTPMPPGEPAGGLSGSAPAPPKVPIINPHPSETNADGSALQEPLVPRGALATLAALVGLVALAALLWFTLLKPQIKSTAQGEVNKGLTANGLAPASAAGANKSTGAKSGNGSGSPAGSNSGGSSTATSVAAGGSTATGGAAAGGVTVNGTSQASGNGTRVVFTVPSGHVLQVTDLLVENSNGDTGTLSVARDGTVLMQWALANFRDLDYHWIAPTIFGAGTHLEMTVSGCSNACTPGIYYAGNLATSG